jgi:oligoendopeptidase F
MYEHPTATPAELKDAVVKIAKDVWNKYYAPVFKVKDVELLAIYSHIIHSFLYLPDYAIGHLISHQIEEYLKGKESIGAEVERMVKIGRIAPDLWMNEATGSPLSAEGMLTASERALSEYDKQSR